MSNKYQLAPRTNSAPIKTYYPNSVGFTSVEEAVIYMVTKKLTRQSNVKMEVMKEDT